MAACLRLPAQAAGHGDALYNAEVKRITVTGASGVGKTVLAEKLAAALGLSLIPETARLLCSEMGHARIGDIPDQEGFKRAVLDRQIDVESEHEGFVADRSAIDCWILWQRWNICSAMTFDTEAFYERTKAHAENYTHIIYVPPLFEPQDDGFRWIEPDYIKQLDRITRTTLYDFDLWPRTFTVSSADLDSRVADVVSWIGAQS